MVGCFEFMMDQILIYGSTLIICAAVIYYYLRSIKKASDLTQTKVDLAKEEGRFEPISLHPHVALSTCIGSGACITACPEKDILGIVDGQATVINATSCIGHGACFHACPVEAISLRIGTESRGVELPHVNQSYETNVAGIYIAGELGGMGLIKNSVEQGKQAVENIYKSLKEPKEGILDLVIIGAGPAGISASLMSKKLGLKFETLEQDTLGGTVYTFPRSKIVMTNPMDLPLHGKVKLFNTSKDELINLWVNVLDENNITIKENTKVDRIIPVEDYFRVVASDGNVFKTNQVLIAIGRRGTPRKLGVEGETLQKVSYRLLEPELIQNKKILVVGGGDSAVESAMLLMDQNEVSLSYRKEQFARIKKQNQEFINQAIASGKIRPIMSSTVTKISELSVDLKVGDESLKIPNDQVFIFIGGELPTGFLKQCGIEIQKRFGYIMKKHE